MRLNEYIVAHTERGQCRCGRCVDGGTEQPVAEHTANLVFFEVAAVGKPDAETLTELIKKHGGAFCECDPLDGKEHSYLELGGWIGDQGLALQLMGLGSLLGLWKLLTPYTVLGNDCPEPMAQKMAGQGFVAVQAS